MEVVVVVAAIVLAIMYSSCSCCKISLPCCDVYRCCRMHGA